MAQRILVVDDEPDILKVVIFRLKKAGFEVEVATNGQIALDLIRNSAPFGMILLDLIMPVMDGYKLCQILKSDDNLKHIPVIILSASATRDIKVKQENLKADDYIVKPFEPEVLLARIHAIFEKKNQGKAGTNDK